MVQATDNQAGDVFTLHQRVSDRWQGSGRIGAGVTVEPMVTGRIDGLIASLPGLASLSGSFGAQAFDIASMLAMESRFAYALSPDLRAMSIGDLADIVQVVLEEEEVELEALETQVRRAKTDEARAAAVKRLKKAQSRHPKRNQIGQHRKVAAVRQALAKVRAEAARVRAEIQRSSSPRTAGDAATFVGGDARDLGVGLEGLGNDDGVDAAAGVYKSGLLGAVGSADPGMLPAIGESLQILRTQPGAGQHSRRRQGFSAQNDVAVSAADLASTVTADHTASRALRLAEWTADMAVLHPGAESAWGTMAPAVDESNVGLEAPRPEGLSFEASSSLGAGAQGAASPRAVLDAYAEVATPQMVPAEHRAALRRAQQVTAQRTVQKQQAQRRVAVSRAQASAAPASDPSRRLGSSAPAYAPRLAAIQALAAARSGATTDAVAGVAGAAEIAAARAGTAAPRLAPLQLDSASHQATPPRASQLSALAGAVQFSATTLARHAAGMQALSPQPTFGAGLDGQREMTRRFAALGDDAAQTGDERAPAGSVSARIGRIGDGSFGDGSFGEGLWDRFSNLLTASVSSGPGLMQRWVAASDAMLGGPASAPRLLDALGAGETLHIAPESAVSADDVRAGAPAWLAPTTRHAAARQRSLFAKTPSSRSADAMAPPLTEAAGSGVQPAVLSGTRTGLDQAPRPQSSPAVALAAVERRPAPAVLGGAAISAFELATSLSSRHFGGLMPAATPAAWMPSTFTRPMVVSDVRSAPTPGSREELTAISSITGIPMESLTRMAPEAVAQMRGVLVDQAGAGEWLLPGDTGHDAWLAQQSEAGERPTAVPPRSRAARRAAAEADPTASHPSASDVRGGAPATAAPALIGAARHGATPHAAAAAIKQVVALHERAAQRDAFVAKAAAGAQTEPRTGLAGRSLLAFARGGVDTLTQSALGALPGGLGDAVTPWIVQRAMERLAPEARERLMMAAGGTGDFLSLDASDAHAPAVDSAASSPAADRAADARGPASLFGPASIATGVAALSPAHRTLLQRITAAGGAATQSLLGGAALHLREPSALRAALALFGEQPAAGGDVADAFLSRFFGRAAPAPARAELSEMTALAAGPDATAGTSSLGAAAAAAGEVADKQVVFSGLAGLQALREMKGAGVSETSLLDLGATERAPEVDSAATAVDGASRGQPAPKSAAASAGTAAKIHRFAPTGLARTRQLLEGRRGSGRISTRRSRFGRGRVGYGAAGLGGGALLGLMPGDTGGFDEGYSGTHASRRAERLGAAVEARRAPRPGQVLRPMPQGGAERTYVSNARAGTPSAAARSSRGGYVGSAAAGFSGGPELVSPVAAMQAAASTGTSGGATAGVKSQQASAMARVLSVTAAPTANVLPLVAPAARAVVAQAAAKPMSESIATSGANATASLQLGGQAVDGEQSGGSGMGAGAQDRQDAGGQPAQELNALAMKVARSVLVRIKRERERRGIYG